MGEAVDRDRKHEERRRKREHRPVLVLETVPTYERRGDERNRAADQGDPGGRRGTAVLDAVAEVAGPEQLGGDPTRQRRREHRDPQQPRGDREPSRQRERKRDEARGTARLRKRHRVGEAGEEERAEHECEDCERAAEHEARPEPLARQSGEREDEQRGDGDRAAAPDDFGLDAVARARPYVQLVAVAKHSVRGAALTLRLKRGRVLRDRIERPENRRRGHGERGDHEREPRPVPAFENDPRHGPATDRHEQEERVRGMNERDSESRRRNRGERARGRLPDGLEGQRERRDD